MKVKVSYKKANRRANHIAAKLLFDLRKEDTVIDDLDKAEVVICYGASPTHIAWYRQFQNKKRFIFLDLGYWDRGGPRSTDASYKMSLDYWHPQKWMDLDLNPSRFKKTGLKIESQKLGNDILLAGLGPKGSHLYGYEHRSWERNMVREIRKHTDRRIIYRPKPSDLNAEPITGTVFRPCDEMTIEKELDNSWAVVSHHSNVCVDATLRGIPFYSQDGAAVGYSMPSLACIENGRYNMPDRDKFFNNLAWFNQSVDDMYKGIAWGFLKELIADASKFTG